MNYKEEVRLRLQISTLEARLAMRQIEATALNREITSALTSAGRIEEAIQRRDVALTDASVIATELDAMRRLFPLLA
jgi:hypothetical protein